jgi:putative aldouronate transport system substrate-binding protein
MKKVLSVMFMVTLACVTLFAGGGSQQQSVTPAPAATGQAVEKAAITDAVLNELGLVKSGNTYRFKETKSITVEVFDRGLDGGRSKPEDNFYTRWIQEGMLRDHNVRVTFKPVPRWTEVDELRTYPGIRPGWTGIRFRQRITAQANSTSA